MAKAETLTPAKPDVLLTLTWEEAYFLAYLIGFHVSGSGPNRTHSNEIYYALKNEGFVGGSLPTQSGANISLSKE